MSILNKLVSKPIGLFFKSSTRTAFQSTEWDSHKWAIISEHRKNTPCKFNDGLSYKDFCAIARKAQKKIPRISDISIDDAVIYCTVQSQTGCSTWRFHVDFNDWGHITGTYWKSTENEDSNIPSSFGHIVSGYIQDFLLDKDISLLDLSDYVDENPDLGTPFDLFYFSKPSFFKIPFSPGHLIASNHDCRALLGEHIYPVISLLKSNGYKNISSVSIEDIDRESDHFPFEVDHILIEGTSSFSVGDNFPENAKIIIAYHQKIKIAVPHSMRFFKKKNLDAVVDQLSDLGFSNIYERKIEDLTTGWLIKDGSVEEILVVIDDDEKILQKNRLYEFDTKIVITYHTFPSNI